MTSHSVNPDDLLVFAPGLRALAARLVGAEYAEDLVQDTWVRALEHPPAEEKPLGPWLVRVLSNLAITTYRERSRRKAREAEVGKSTLDALKVPTPGEISEELEAADKLMRAVSALDELPRTIVSMRYFRGHSSAQIGKLLDLPAPTVRWHLQAAVASMRVSLAGEDRGVPGGWTAAIVPLLRISSQPAKASGVVGLVSAPWFVAAVLAMVLGAGAWFAMGSGVSDLDSATEDVLSARTSMVPGVRVSAPDLGEDQDRTKLDGDRRSIPLVKLVAAGSANPKDEPSASAGEAVGVAKRQALHLSLRMACRLVDAKGRPIAGAELGLAGPRNEFAVSDRDGRCELVLTGPGTGAGSPSELIQRAGGLCVVAEGYVTRTVPAIPLLGADLCLGDLVLEADGTDQGAAAALDGEAAPEPVGELSTLAVLVVNPQGEPIPGAVVSLDGGPFGQPTFVADGQGEVRAELKGDATGAILAYDPDHRYAPVRMENVALDGHRRTLALGEARTLEFLVRSSGDEELGSVTWFQVASIRRPSAMVQSGESDGAVVVPVAVDMELRGSKAGLVIEAPGHSPYVTSFRKLAKQEWPMVVELAALETVGGRVTAGGSPVSGARVSIAVVEADFGTARSATRSPSRRMEQVVLTGSDGVFRVAVPNPGPYSVCVAADGLAPVLKRYTGMGKPTNLETIEMEVGGTLIGQVKPQLESASLGATGPLLHSRSSMGVVALHEDGERRVVRVGLVPTYEVTGLAAGRWEVQLVSLDEGGEPGEGIEEARNIDVLSGRLSFIEHRP